MDVSHTDHSHIIGKGGGNIKRGMLQVYFNNIDINTQYSIVQKKCKRNAEISFSHVKVLVKVRT